MNTSLLNQYERQFIREYNSDVQQGRKRYKLLFMSSFEMTKAKRDFQKALTPYFDKFLNRVL